ncbi:MAG: enoyl-CoA hydratase/isomerase family protein [Dehalococcoidia bacterium]
MAGPKHFSTVDLDWPTSEIARITLNRPDAGNSLSSQLVTDLTASLRTVRFEPGCKVLLITGAGRFFCAGADLKEKDRPSSWIWDLRRAFDLIEELPVPVVALINGSCMGGGTELALACDFRIALRSVSLGLPEIQFGALPAAGGPQRLLRLVGPARAKLLIMSGEHIPASRAMEIGLLEECVDGDLEAAGMDFAARLALRAGYAVRATKFLINRGINMPLSDALALDYQVMDTMASPEERRAEMEKAAARSKTYAKIFS